MSNLANYFNFVICKDRELCKSPKHYCTTCLRNTANRYRDNFSLTGEIESEWNITNNEFTKRLKGAIKNGK